MARNRFKGMDVTKKVFNRQTGREEIPLETIVALREAELSYEEIGKLVGCSKATIANRLKPVLGKIKAVGNYRKARSNLLAVKEMDILGGITPEKIEKTAVKDLAFAFDKVYAAGRLEDNKSTANIATYAHLLREKEQVEDDLREDENELKELEAYYGPVDESEGNEGDAGKVSRETVSESR